MRELIHMSFFQNSDEDIVKREGLLLKSESFKLKTYFNGSVLYIILMA